MKTLAIVGGGASGMLAGITALETNPDIHVIIFDQKDILGKKILSTGNGRCNLTNKNMSLDYFRSDEPQLISSVLKAFGYSDTIRFFENLGLLMKSRNGYIYPRCDQASVVRSVLDNRLKELGADIRRENAVTSICRTKKGFQIETGSEKIQADRIILSAGGKASSKLGSDGSGYTLVKSLGHSVVPVVPALVQLKVKDFAFQKASGVRTDAKVTALINGRMAASDTGELQITNYGISGIPVFQVSRYISRALYEKKNAQVMIDFLPELEEASLRELFNKKLQHLSENQKAKPEDLLTGILHTKLIPEILRISGIRFSAKLNMIKGAELTRLCEVIKSCRLNISDTNGFDNAQVSAGGVSLKEVDMETMQSCITKDLYLAGELLDVDGICGGYNLQWAWATGYLAGKHAASDYNNYFKKYINSADS